MSSQPIIYPSPWKIPLTLPDTPLNVWDFLCGTIPEAARTSLEPRCIQVESDEAFSMPQIIHFAETLAKYLHGSFAGRRSTWNTGGPNVDYDVITVGVLSPNTLQVPLLAYSCMAAGLPLAPLPAGSSSSEIAFLARLAQCEIVFTHPSQLKIIQGSGYPVERIILTEPSEQWHGKTLPDLLKIASQLPPFTTLLQHPIPKHEVALVVLSSGSTGKPKAVMITHRNICALVIAKAITARSDLDEQEKQKTVTLSVLPMYHIYGFLLGVILPILDGITQCIMRSWEVNKALRAIAQYKVTAVGLVPTMALQIISAADRLENVDLSSLASVFVGSSAITPGQKQKLFEVLASRGALTGQQDGSAIFDGYGMSETMSGITTWSKDGTLATRARPGTVGYLIPGAEARIISESSSHPAGEDVPKHTAGELCLRGPTIMKGYLGDPQATRATFTSDGWLKTGDKVMIDADGHLVYIDRLKDTFKNRGKQVSPSEIASLIYAHHSGEITELAVIGVAAGGNSQRSIGDEAWAFVVPKGASSVTREEKDRLAESIMAVTRKHLSIHKHVVRVLFLDQLPKGPTHKVLLKALRNLAADIVSDGKLHSKL